MAKSDINDTYVSELEKYQILVMLGTGRSASGGTWSSTSSSTLYSYTSETDLMNQLYTVLEDFLITADSWNDVERKVERYGASSGGTDAYAVTNTTVTLVYYAGMVQTFKADVGNTGAATLNVDGLGAKDLKKFGAGGKAALATGDIIANGFYTCVYDGTDFILFNPSAILQSLFTAQGDILYASAANTPAVLAKGTARKQLSMNSGATAPEWSDSMQSIATTTGDMLYANAANTIARLGIDADSTKVLGISGGVPAWTQKLTIAKGNGSDTSTSVSPGYYTKSIALGCSPVALLLTLYDTSAISKWQDYFIDTSSKLAYKAGGYPGGTYAVSAGEYGVDASHNSMWVINSSSHSVYSVRINGTNLEITIYNTGGGPATMTMGWYWMAIG